MAHSSVATDQTHTDHLGKQEGKLDRVKPNIRVLETRRPRVNAITQYFIGDTH